MKIQKIHSSFNSAVVGASNCWNFFMSSCTIISSVILGRFHENLFTFFFLPGVKKNPNCCGIFLMKSRNLLPIGIQRCLVLNLPQNKFHKNNLKTEKNHNKFSSQIFVRTSQINVRNYRTKRTWTSFWCTDHGFEFF